MRLALVVFALTAASCGRIRYDRSFPVADAADASSPLDAPALGSETSVGTADSSVGDAGDMDSTLEGTLDARDDVHEFRDGHEADGHEDGALEGAALDSTLALADVLASDGALAIDVDPDSVSLVGDASQDPLAPTTDAPPDVPPDTDPCAGVSITVNAPIYPMMEVDRAFTGQFEASPALSGGLRYVYTSPNLPFGALNPSTALWNGTPTITMSTTVRIVATGPDGCQGHRDFSVEIACSPTLAAVPSTLPNAQVGVFYNAPFSIVPNPNGARYSVIGRVGPPPLPPGLSGTGDPLFITGTPTMSGSYTFQLVIIGTNGCRVFPTYTIVVDP